MDWSEAEGTNVVVELHDSEVVSMHPEGRTLVIRLSPAWIHRSIGIPGRDEGTVWNQDAVLRLDDALDAGAGREFPPWLVTGSNPKAGRSGDYDIRDGSVSVDGVVIANCIPAPADLSGDIRLLFEFGTATIHLAASRFRLDLVGEPEFIDVWRPD